MVRVTRAGRAVHDAAGSGNDKELAKLLKRELDRDPKKKASPPLCNDEEHDRCPVNVAAGGGFDSSIIILIKAGFSATSRDKYGFTPLHRAADGGHAKCLAVLIAAGASIDAVDEKGLTPLCYAAIGGHCACLSALIAAGADIDAEDRVGSTALHAAAAEGHADCIVLLTQAGAQTDAQDYEGQTPLHVAALCGETECIAKLLAAGASTTVKDNNGQTPCALATTDEDRTLLAEMEEEGDEEEEEEARTSPATPPTEEKKRRSVDGGGDGSALAPGSRFRSDEQPTSHHQQLEPTKVAPQQQQTTAPSLPAPAQQLSPKKIPEAALYFAAMHGQGDLVRELLQRPDAAALAAYCDKKDGTNVLHAAINSGSADLIPLLVAAGAEIEAESGTRGEAWTPLHFAAHRGDLDCLRALLSEKADINARAGDGKSALHIACKFDRVECAEILLKCGAVASAKDHYGKLPYDLLPEKSPLNHGLRLLLCPLPESTADEREGLEDSGTTFDSSKTAELFTQAKVKLIPRHRVLICPGSKAIGSGGFGKVYAGKYYGGPVAIKTLIDVTKHAAVGEIIHEASVLQALQHPNIVTFYGVSVHSTDMYIVMRLMSGGTVWNKLHRPAFPMDARLKMNWALQTASGMSYLHDMRIIHRDLKSANLLLDDALQVSVADFGLSRVKAGLSSVAITRAGTHGWQPPEMYADKPKHTFKVDLYSYGIVLWEFGTRRVPFQDLPVSAIFQLVKIKGKRPEPLPPTGGEDQLPKEFLKLIEDCWHQLPEKRPTFDAVVLRLEGMLEEYNDTLRRKSTAPRAGLGTASTSSGSK